MMTTESMPGQVLDRSAASAPLDPPPSAGLALTAGDAAGYAAANREHDGAGVLFVFLCNATALLCVMGAVIATGLPPFDGLGLALQPWMSPLFILAAVLQRALAKGVGRFTRWGWMGAMAELGLAALTELPTSLDVGDWMSSIITVGINVLWMRYFWRRRADFDIDIDR